MLAAASFDKGSAAYEHGALTHIPGGGLLHRKMTLQEIQDFSSF